MKWLDNLFRMVYTTPQQEIEILRAKARVHRLEASRHKAISRSYDKQAHLLEARLENQERQSHVRSRKEQTIQPD